MKVPFFLVAGLAPAMAERGWGSIVNVSTMVASFGQAGRALYGASRAGLELLTKAWAAEYGPRCSGQRRCPADAHPMMESVPEEMVKQAAAQAPAGRVAEPEELAAAIVFLASDDASFIHGAHTSPQGSAPVTRATFRVKPCTSTSGHGSPSPTCGNRRGRASSAATSETAARRRQLPDHAKRRRERTAPIATAAFAVVDVPEARRRRRVNSALLDYIDPDLEERGLVNGAIIRPDREKESLLEFLAEVPTAWNQVEMKRVQHADRGRRWRDNDHYDINPFSVALTYCDALVAEGHWADKIRRADLQTLNECELMTTVEELRLYLAGL